MTILPQYLHNSINQSFHHLFAHKNVHNKHCDTADTKHLMYVQQGSKVAQLPLEEK